MKWVKGLGATVIHNRTRKMNKALLKNAKRQAFLWKRFHQLEDAGMTGGATFKLVMWALLKRIEEGRNLDRQIKAGL